MGHVGLMRILRALPTAIEFRFRRSGVGCGQSSHVHFSASLLLSGATWCWVERSSGKSGIELGVRTNVKGSS